jgi:hypothetical protein
VRVEIQKFGVPRRNDANRLGALIGCHLTAGGIYLCKYLLIMVRTNVTLQYHCYRATNATDARIGCVPTVPTPVYRCVGQFANTVTSYHKSTM